MTHLGRIEQDPPIGRSLRDLAEAGHCPAIFPLAAAADCDRVALFHPAEPQPGEGPFGRHMRDPAFRRYRHDALVAHQVADAYLLGADGIVMLEGGVVADTLADVSAWHPESNVTSVEGDAILRLRAPLPVVDARHGGTFAVGFNGAWRNHGRWLMQCLPKLHAFNLLRQRLPDLKLLLPPLPRNGAHLRTLDLLGIPPHAVAGVGPNEASFYRSAILLPNFDVWAVPEFVVTAADAVVAGVPPPAADAPPRPDKIYIHRTVPARRLANVDALQPLLARYGFTAVSFEAMDFAEQVATMQAARHVVSEHGSGTANIMFCRPAARILELFNPYCVQPAFWTLASRRGLEYGYIVGSHSASAERPAPDWNSDYTVTPQALEDGIRALLRLPPRPIPPRPVPPLPVPVAAVPPPPPVAGPPVAIAGVAEPIFEIVSNPPLLGHGRGHERLPLFAPAMPPPALPMHPGAALPEPFAAEHNRYRPPTSVAAYAIAGGVVWSTGLVSLGQEFVAPADCLPGYFADRLRAGAPPLHPVFGGALGRADVRTITLDRPVAVATHPNLAYGHGIMDVLPRLWLLAVLREYGADLPLALSSTVPDWVKLFARALHAEANIIWYDGAHERIAAPGIVLPGMLHTDYNFHPAINLMVRDLVQRVPPPDANSPKLLYVAQANFGEEKLSNAAEIEQAMRDLGFSVVRLATLSPAQHVRTFSGASVVVGEYGFAMCATLFCRPGTRVIALNFSAHYLSAIARVRGLRIAFLPPFDGQFRHWRLSPDKPRDFGIDVAALRKLVKEMMEGIG